MGRFFAFGCSFTDYPTPTWADFYGSQADEYYNLAKVGAGNRYIFEKLVEADITYQFNIWDTIIIMWSTYHRHDLYKDGGWSTPGNIFSASEVYDEDYIAKYFDIEGCILHTFNYIHAAKKLLRQSNANWKMTSMAPMTTPINEPLHQFGILHRYLERLTEVKTIFTEFPNLQKYESLFDSDWLSIDAMTHSKKFYREEDFSQISYDGPTGQLHRDHHPTPRMHLDWLVRNDLLNNTEKQEQLLQEWSQLFPDNKIQDTEKSEIWLSNNIRRTQ